MQRDANGRAQVAAPSAEGDIATKGYVDSIYKIGDCYPPTLRNDLGDDWLLRNGASVIPTEYPELTELLGFSLGSAAWTELAIDGNALMALYEAPYHVVLTQSALYVSENPFNDGWTKITPSVGDTYVGIVKGGDQWVIWCNAVGGKLLHTNDLFSSWTSVSGILPSCNQFSNVAYHDGYWVWAGSVVNPNWTFVYKYSTDLVTWIACAIGPSTLSFSLGCHPHTICFVDGYWVCGPLEKTYIYYKSGTPNGSWAKGAAALFSVSLAYIIEAGGYLFTIGNNGSGDYTAASYAASPTGTFTAMSINYALPHFWDIVDKFYTKVGSSLFESDTPTGFTLVADTGLSKGPAPYYELRRTIARSPLGFVATVFDVAKLYQTTGYALDTADTDGYYHYIRGKIS
jgi:hypothetical protein